MKDTRSSGMEKIRDLWKSFASELSDKINKKRKSFSDKTNEARDMGDTHTPISRLDLTGMNREQAKELIGRLIDEKLEMVSRIELAEPKIDYLERERLRAMAAERMNKRRKKRGRSKVAAEPAETVVTDQGVFSDYTHASVFDVIQPESFPFEEEKAAKDAAVPIEGQLSILDTVHAETIAAGTPAAAPSAVSGFIDLLILKYSNLIRSLKKKKPAESEPDPELYQPHDFDLFGIFPYQPDQEACKGALKEQEAPAAAPALAAEVSAGEIPAEEFGIAEAADRKSSIRIKIRKEGYSVSTSLDEAVDKVFGFYEEYKGKLLRFSQSAGLKASGIVRGAVLPAAASGMKRVSSRLTPLLQRAESRLQLKNKAGIALAAVSGQEKKLSGKMARAVDFADRINEAFLRAMADFRDKVCLCNCLIREFAERHKKEILVEVGVMTAVIAVVVLSVGNATAYEYIYNGKVLGVVKNQEDVYKTIDIIGDKLSVQYDADILIDKEKDIRFKKIVALNQDTDSQEDILNRLTYMRDMKANGKGIYVDGSLMAVLESEKTAKNILQEVQDEFLKADPNIHYQSIGFAEDIAIRDVETKLGGIEDKDEVFQYLMTGAVEQKVHVVQSGETFSEIAKMYGIKQSELQATNQDVIPEKLHIGQEIRLNRIVPLVTVQTTEIAEYKEEIPFDITYENTSALYKDEQTVKSRGVAGEKDVVAEIVRNNGIEVDRKEVSSTLLSPPKSQVVLVGTKEPPPLIGTGTFVYPIRGTLTSRYGTRWGRLHAGIDLAAPTGTHIKAADGGVVTFSGYNGALGYMVAIDHGGGRVTWYGHCSKLLVKKGEKVYQGQYIANVGNTGSSTGPHLHFEVHINGKTKNPLDYL
jgi:murein DD-endopeptidase MepM/ murein hydrolase activator NlpD